MKGALNGSFNKLIALNLAMSPGFRLPWLHLLLNKIRQTNERSTELSMVEKEKTLSKVGKVHQSLCVSISHGQYNNLECPEEERNHELPDIKQVAQEKHQQLMKGTVKP